MTPSRALTPVVRAAALAIALLVAAGPLVVLFRASFRVKEVWTTDGRHYRVAGSVRGWEHPIGPVPAAAPGTPSHPSPPPANLVAFDLPTEGDPDGDLTPVSLPRSKVAKVTEVWSLAHYRDVFSSRRTVGLVVNSGIVSGGGALLALLLGIPVGWLVARTRWPGRRVLAALLPAPLLLPPFFHAMGVSDALGGVLSRLGFHGGALQMANSVVTFAEILFPVPALLVGRALASVPRGLSEAARLAGGKRAELRFVVLPSVLPAALASLTLSFVLALSDFAVPDLLGVFLPDRGAPVHVFATEVFLQWNRYENVGRAVATGAPFCVATAVLVALAAWLVMRCPKEFLGAAAAPREPVRLRGAGLLAGWGIGGLALALGLAFPLIGVASWGFSPWRIPATVEATAGVLPETARWLEIGVLSAALSTVVAVVLARWATRGGTAVRALVATVGALPLAVPGMAMGAGTLLLWVGVPTPPDTLWKPVLLLSGRFLPYALLASWLALREVDRRLEEAARLSGATPFTSLWRVTEPLARRGWVSAFLLVLVMALREVDSLVLVETGILPIRIYDKVHWGKTGAVADLSMAYVGVLLVPAVLAALLLRRSKPDTPPAG